MSDRSVQCAIWTKSSETTVMYCIIFILTHLQFDEVPDKDDLIGTEESARRHGIPPLPSIACSVLDMLGLRASLTYSRLLYSRLLYCSVYLCCFVVMFVC